MIVSPAGNEPGLAATMTIWPGFAFGNGFTLPFIVADTAADAGAVTALTKPTLTIGTNHKAFTSLKAILVSGGLSSIELDGAASLPILRSTRAVSNRLP